MPEISSADFQLFQEYMKSRAPALAPAPAPAAPEVKTIDECLMTFRDCVVDKDQAMAMAPASSTSMALAPATAADGFAVGVSVNCKANDPSTATITGGAGGGGTKVYRYMGSKTINHYPNPEVAASWNPSWGSINTIDCAGLTVGPTMTLAPATPSVLSSGYAHEGSPFGGLVGRRNWRLVLILFLLVIMLWIIAKKM